MQKCACNGKVWFGEKFAGNDWSSNGRTLTFEEMKKRGHKDDLSGQRSQSFFWKSRNIEKQMLAYMAAEDIKICEVRGCAESLIQQNYD